MRLPELEMEMSKRSRNVISCNFSSFPMFHFVCQMRNYLINSMIIKARGKISEQTNNFNLTFVLNIKHIDDSNHFNLSIQSLKIFHEYKFFDKKN